MFPTLIRTGDTLGVAFSPFSLKITDSSQVTFAWCLKRGSSPPPNRIATQGDTQGCDARGALGSTSHKGHTSLSQTYQMRRGAAWCAAWDFRVAEITRAHLLRWRVNLSTCSSEGTREGPTRLSILAPTPCSLIQSIRSKALFLVQGSRKEEILEELQHWGDAEYSR